MKITISVRIIWSTLLIILIILLRSELGSHVNCRLSRIMKILSINILATIDLIIWLGKSGIVVIVGSVMLRILVEIVVTFWSVLGKFLGVLLFILILPYIDDYFFLTFRLVFYCFCFFQN